LFYLLLMQIHVITSLATKATRAVMVNCVVEAVARTTAPVVVFMHTTKGALGNAVPLKLMTPVVAVPPVPTLTLPASGVLPAVTAGEVPNPDDTVGNEILELFRCQTSS
jgi:hypothetical protein